MFILRDVTCGSITIDSVLPNFISTLITVIKIAIPIILIVLGILDLAKAVIANEEKEMKEAQKTLIKRIIYAIVIFFVVAIVQFVFGQLAKADSDSTAGANNATSCINCFVNGKCN